MCLTIIKITMEILTCTPSRASQLRVTSSRECYQGGLGQGVILFQRQIAKARYWRHALGRDKRFRGLNYDRKEKDWTQDMKAMRRKHLLSEPGSCSLEFSTNPSYYSGLPSENGAQSMRCHRGKVLQWRSILLGVWQASRN